MSTYRKIVVVGFNLLLTFFAVQPALGAKNPNFIVILADDLGYGDLSCYDGWIETPNIDRLAREGLRFTDFHSNGAVCSPTRAALLTGRYQQRTGVDSVVVAARSRQQHFRGLQPSEVTFAESLKECGYATAIFGKWHVGYYRKYNPLRHGFDRFRGYVSGNIDFISHIDQTGQYDWWDGERFIEEEGYSTHLITKHGIKYIEENKDRPFCLYLAHEAPHYPYQGPNDKADRTVGGKFDTHGSRPDRKDAYREMVDEMDKGVGQVVAKLKELQLDKKTLVFFFSDNGAVSRYGSCAPLRGNKGTVWEGGHRVPAIAWWPGTIAPGTTDQLAIGMDLFPTMLSLAGTAAPPGQILDGVDLNQLLLHGRQLGHRRLFWEHGNQQAVRDGRWKLVRNTNAQKQPGLYDLEKDIGEMDNLAETHPKRTKEMLAALEAWKHEMVATATPQPRTASESGLPRVLIVGDSISNGYTRPLREILKGKAEVFHNPGNARHTGIGLEKLHDWLGDEPWDVIHFNWGLHDLCYRHPEAKTPGRRDKLNGEIEHTLAEYETNLRELAKRLRRTRAKLIWASTTPVPDGEIGRIKGDELKYNAVAEKVIKEHRIPINDLHAFVSPRFEEFATRPGDVHFTKEGSKYLAEKVAKEILDLLGIR